jgi:hypothetical protein
VENVLQIAVSSGECGIEGFWSIFKRGGVGTFHKFSAKYLPLYVAKFQFRYNNRDNTDIFGDCAAGMLVVPYAFSPPINSRRPKT